MKIEIDMTDREYNLLQDALLKKHRDLMHLLRGDESSAEVDTYLSLRDKLRFAKKEMSPSRFTVSRAVILHTEVFIVHDATRPLPDCIKASSHNYFIALQKCNELNRKEYE